jgi:D-lactate dehydrogenase
MVEKLIGSAVHLGHASEKFIGAKGLTRLTVAVEGVTGSTLPKWNNSIPYSPNVRHQVPEQKDFVYFPSCISRQLGLPHKDNIQEPMSLMDVLIVIAERAGISLFIPGNLAGVCCGMPFSSKGYKNAYRKTIHNTLMKFWTWSEQGKLPIIIDTTSCVYSLRTNPGISSSLEDVLSPDVFSVYKQLKIVDSIEFIHDTLMPRLKINSVDGDVMLHPNCSARKLGLDSKLQAIAKKCAKSVNVPLNLGCCAFAGDRGLLFPELTRSATRMEAKETNSKPYDGYYSSNIPCEIGMSSATGNIYKGIAYLVEKASR